MRCGLHSRLQSPLFVCCAGVRAGRIADPGNGVTFAQTADVHFQHSQFDVAALALEEAARLFEAQIKLEPGNPKPASDLGKAYFLLGDLPSSVRAFEAAVKLSPDEPQLCYLLGVVHAQNGNGTSARAAFESVVSDPKADNALQQEARKALDGLK